MTLKDYISNSYIRKAALVVGTGLLLANLQGCGSINKTLSNFTNRVLDTSYYESPCHDKCKHYLKYPDPLGDGRDNYNYCRKMCEQ
jgi:hypothetical protein